MLIFSLLTGIGASLGVWQVVRSAPVREELRWADAALLALLLALIGARAAHVGLEWTYYQLKPLEILQVWMGGLSWWGAVVGGVLSVPLAARYLQMPLAKAADGLFRMVTPLAVGAWLGCWQVGSAYGSPAPLGAWWGVPSADEAGVVIARAPLQLLAALMILVFEWLCVRFGDLSSANGLYAGLSLFNLAGSVLLVSFFSAQPARQVQGLALDSWIALGIGLLALGSLVVKLLVQRGRKNHAN